jgi:mannose/cellobiose epimerase-like protein (N-acyl-D-glucosamine 2-epimerase family)
MKLHGGVPAGQAGLRWLTDQAWPFWLERGVDWQRGAFHEHLDATSLQCHSPFRRLRVAARQTYVFSKAARYGLPHAKEAVALGLDFLQGPARLPDGGFAWRFDLDNRPIDLTRDLYDHTFVLLAFSAAAEVVGAERVRADAVTLVDHIAARFAHPAGGYRDRIPPPPYPPPQAGEGREGVRPQNPHMHLFEALLAASETFGGEPFFNCASGLAALFAARLFQAKEGALPEYFDEALAPRREAGRFVAEPGHHYEWIWLLHWYETAAAAMGVAMDPALKLAADSLFEFAERHGVSPLNGLVANGLWSDGRVSDGGFRLWPQTERLKAAARRRPDRVPAVLDAIERHFAGVRPGLWIERIDAMGNAIAEPAPATSLYHLTAAFTDDAVLRLGT